VHELSGCTCGERGHARPTACDLSEDGALDPFVLSLRNDHAAEHVVEVRGGVVALRAARTISRPSPAGTSLSPRGTASSSTAGGELRLGTVAMYMRESYR